MTAAQNYSLVGFLVLYIGVAVYGNDNVRFYQNVTLTGSGNESGWAVVNEYGTVRASGKFSIERHVPIRQCNPRETCRKQPNEVQVVEAEDGSCLHISTTAHHAFDVLEDCVDLGTANWFGGPQYFTQLWPVEKLNFSEYSYVTKGYDNMAIVERYWLNSNGIYIYVDPEVPLFIDQNRHRNNSLCFIAENKAPYLERKSLSLSYSICGLDQANAQQAHLDAVDRFLGKPTGVPDERMVRHPIWSTWARYKTNISQDSVLEFAGQILVNGFNNSQLEIDDLWETCYGSLTFDTHSTKFPDMRNLSLTLKSLGFRVTLWIHPFINSDCEPYYTYALVQDYFVKDVSGSEKTEWWNGKAAIIDFTNPRATKWWVGNLQRLLDNKLIDSFKVDAGESGLLPQIPVLNTVVDQQPGVFTKAYSTIVSQFGTSIEIRVGQHTQNLPIFIRMSDKYSRWGYDNGLKTLVTTLLQLNMVGYPFVLPDMIGGNGYNGELPSKEIFIRWLQANTFMPSLQFSYVPWDFDQETIDICQTFTKLHFEYSNIIMSLAEKAVQDGSPINPPIWWIDPTDPVALATDDEFLLGETVLVAPVLEEGATSRDIYLPRGTWTDNVSGQEGIVGPTWLRDYPAPLDTLPYFTRVVDGNHVHVDVLS